MNKTFAALLFFVAALYATKINSQTAKFEPPNGKIYHGVGQAGIGEHEYVNAISDSCHLPIMRNYYFSIPSTRPDKLPIYYKTLRQRLDTMKQQNLFPELSIDFHGPLSVATDFEVASSKYDSIIDSLAVIIKSYGRRMFIRPGFEFNGSWNGYSPFTYVNAYKKIVDRLKLNGVSDSVSYVWCYEPAAKNDFDSLNGNGYLWYPGDNYVDWFGLDVFKYTDFKLSLPNYSGPNITNKGKSERFLQWAVTKNKPVHMSECSADATNITSDTITDGPNDWNNWFSPFFQFLTGHPEIKAFIYINWNWGNGAYAITGDARINQNAYITKQYNLELTKSKYIHLNNCTFSNITTIENKNAFSFETFPNPVSNHVNVLLNTGPENLNVEITIYDILGAIHGKSDIINKSGSANAFEINTSSLPNGIYILSIKASATTYNKKIVVSN